MNNIESSIYSLLYRKFIVDLSFAAVLKAKELIEVFLMLSCIELRVIGFNSQKIH